VLKPATSNTNTTDKISSARTLLAECILGSSSNRPVRTKRMVATTISARPAGGLATILSSFGPKETMERLEAEIKAKGMTEFARIDHAAGAAEVGLPLRPTELLIARSCHSPTSAE
jgi:hypothetical protein